MLGYILLIALSATSVTTPRGAQKSLATARSLKLCLKNLSCGLLSVFIFIINKINCDSSK